MNCNDIHELAPLYVCGELDATRAAEFDAHLKVCPSCLQEIEEQSQLDARLRRALLAEDLDVSRVNRRVRELMAAEPMTPGVGTAAAPAVRPPATMASISKSSRSSRRRWISAAAGIAAAFVLAAAGYLLLPGKFSHVYADAALDHQDEVIGHSPRRWFTDPAQIAAVEKYFGLTIDVPRELSGGYYLEHAKVCQLDGKLYVHAVYTDGIHEFSLFLRPRDKERLTGSVQGIANGRLLHASLSGDEHLASFKTARLLAVVATNQDASSAIADARLASSAIND
jgi:Putative zinc-finger